jgi:hypothetical protein
LQVIITSSRLTEVYAAIAERARDKFPEQRCFFVRNKADQAMADLM